MTIRYAIISGTKLDGSFGLIAVCDDNPEKKVLCKPGGVPANCDTISDNQNKYLFYTKFVIS